MNSLKCEEPVIYFDAMCTSMKMRWTKGNKLGLLSDNTVFMQHILLQSIWDLLFILILCALDIYISLSSGVINYRQAFKPVHHVLPCMSHQLQGHLVCMMQGMIKLITQLESQLAFCFCSADTNSYVNGIYVCMYIYMYVDSQAWAYICVCGT